MAIRPAIETLNRIGYGAVMEEFSEKLAAAVLSTDQTGKPTKVTLTIDLKRATANTLKIGASIKSKLPEPPAVEVLMYPTPEGNLLSEDPAQGKLPLKAVEQAPVGELKQVAH